MSEHRDRANELLLHYLKLAASGTTFEGDNFAEIRGIVDEIIEAATDAPNKECDKRLGETNGWLQRLQDDVDRIVGLGATVEERLTGVETLVETLEIRWTRLVELEAKIATFDQRNEDERRDRLAINCLRMSVDKLNDTLGDGGEVVVETRPA